MRSLFLLAALALAALCFLTPTARAEWREEGDGSWVFKADDGPAAKPTACTCGPGCACPEGACPGACPVAVLPGVQSVGAPTGAGHYEKRCTTDARGRQSCTLVWVADAEPAKPAAASVAAPVVSAAPVEVSERSGWHPGKLLKRIAENRPKLFGVRVGRGCASCGQ